MTAEDLNEPLPVDAWETIRREQETNPYYPFLSEPGVALEEGVPVDYVQVCNTGIAKDAASVTAFWKAGVPAEWVKEIVPTGSDRVGQYIEAWSLGIPPLYLRLTAFHILPTRIRLWRTGLRVEHIRELGMTATLPDVLDAAALGFPVAALRGYSEAGYDVEDAARLHDYGIPPEYADAGNLSVERLMKLWDEGVPEEYLRAMREPVDAGLGTTS